MYYQCSENKGTDQLRGYCEADLRLFSHMRIVGFLMRRLVYVVYLFYFVHCAVYLSKLLTKHIEK